MNKPKILLISKLYHPWIGGVEQHVKLLAEELAGEFDIKVLCCQEPNGESQIVTTHLRHSRAGGNPEYPEINGLDSRLRGNDEKKKISIHKTPSLGIYWSMPVSPAFPWWLRRLAADADLVHLHLPFPLAELAYFMVRPSSKLVITWHSDIVRQKFLSRVFAPLSRWILGRADRIITTSDRLLENSLILRPFGRQTQVIPLGIKTETFALTPKIEKQALEIRRRFGSPLILFIGRLVPYKGLSYLLQALPLIVGNTKALIIGEGSLKKKLEQEAALLKLNGRAVFLGKVTDEELPAFYHACDIFVLPSVASNEAFGIVQMEAMAAGKPVINTALPTGVPSISLDQKTGLTVPPGDSKALAQAINKLLGDEAWRRALGRQALERVRDHYDAQTMAQRVGQIYSDTLRNS